MRKKNPNTKQVEAALKEFLEVTLDETKGGYAFYAGYIGSVLTTNFEALPVAVRKNILVQLKNAANQCRLEKFDRLKEAA